MIVAGPGIAELGRLFRSGALSPRQAVERSLVRLAEWEPRLNAFAHVMGDSALADADRLGTELASGHDRGPLHGIPIAIKDLIDVEGAPTGYGSKVLPPKLATRDAELVRRLREAGAIVIGKTNLLEYAYGIAHPEIGQTNNPHDPTRTSGGSSGGSAAAVAAGIVPLAIGTDTGGSIRIPAAYCGIVGLKPSFGLVSLDGVFPLSQSLDHAGPLTLTVADAALALAVLSGTDVPLHPVNLDGLRIGRIARHFASHEVTAGVRQAIDTALHALAAAGTTFIDVDIPRLAEANTALGIILRPEATLIHAELRKANSGGYAPGTLTQIESGAEIRAVDYVAAQHFRVAMRDEVERLFGIVDALIGPSVPFVAPFSDPVIAEGEVGEMLSSGLGNFTGHPAVSLPAGLADGLPVGLQIMAHLGRDDRLLSIANAIEMAIAG